MISIVLDFCQLELPVNKKITIFKVTAHWAWRIESETNWGIGSFSLNEDSTPYKLYKYHTYTVASPLAVNSSAFMRRFRIYLRQ